MPIADDQPLARPGPNGLVLAGVEPGTRQIYDEPVLQGASSGHLGGVRYLGQPGWRAGMGEACAEVLRQIIIGR